MSDTSLNHNNRTFHTDGDSCTAPNAASNTASKTDQAEKSGACEQKNASEERKPLVIFSAGGKGTRIQSLNSSVPKPMIPIAGKPILRWGIENLVEQGYTNFIITVSYMADQIEDYFGDGSKFGCSIEYFYEENALGNAGALFKLWEEGKIGEGESFLYLIADAIFSIDFDRFYDYHISHDAIATLFTHPNSHPYDSSVLVLKGGNERIGGKDRIDGISGESGTAYRVVDWLMKEDDRGQWYHNTVNAGLQILTTDLLKLSRIDPASVGFERKVDLDRDILKPLIPSHSIYSYTSSEYCKDAGTPKRFHSVEDDLLSGRVAAKNLKNPQKAIFLDRDGTINKYNGFVREPQSLELLPTAAEAIRLINQSGFLAIVITNQPVIARGEVTPAELDIIHCKMETELGKAGAYVDGIYICPHHPDKGFAGEVASLKVTCDCRKPKPGLLLRAASDFNINLEESVFIGDSWRDVKAGQSAGCKTVYLNGAGTESEGSDTCGHDCTPDMICDNLLDAVERIL